MTTEEALKQLRQSRINRVTTKNALLREVKEMHESARFMFDVSVAKAILQGHGYNRIQDVPDEKAQLVWSSYVDQMTPHELNPEQFYNAAKAAVDQRLAEVVKAQLALLKDLLELSCGAVEGGCDMDFIHAVNDAQGKRIKNISDDDAEKLVFKFLEGKA